MFRLTRCAAILLPVLFSSTGTARAELSVVASIPPVHSLVAKVMAGAGEPHLILRNGQSPHDYSLRPSDAHALEKADLVFLISHRVESFLDASLDSAEGDGRFVELGDAHGVLHLPVREGVLWEHHDHDDHGGHGGEKHGHDDHEGHAEHGDGKHESKEHLHDAHEDAHDHEGYDPHVWLSTRNAKAFVDAIAEALTRKDPAHAALYADNAKTAHRELAALGESISAKLAPVRGRPFLVFHDAYQYFEAEFDFAAAGAISIGTAAAPGAKRLRELRHRASEGDIRCIFREVQFSPRLAEVVAEGTGTRIGTLDPIGSTLDFGPDNYDGLMLGLADGFLSCLE
ncbi:zinc ABC transporter substrate-binding protein [Nisaea acidiphila]|uniref:High-affinity zinc uptake system protein ZnuA n=1 Tax=Nisaea acidiphila TaxID=1862145 RepID=A0A9J7APR4_9PROT|nr:zinc ABC transporter substrate-binding protein [Nisaea acidiphila]UUX48585.1 zinc ABC transporter substrate-binding protein [Nisaea acidiphila]